MKKILYIWIFCLLLIQTPVYASGYGTITGDIGSEDDDYSTIGGDEGGVTGDGYKNIGGGTSNNTTWTPQATTQTTTEEITTEVTTEVTTEAPTTEQPTTEITTEIISTEIVSTETITEEVTENTTEEIKPKKEKKSLPKLPKWSVFVISYLINTIGYCIFFIIKGRV